MTTSRKRKRIRNLNPPEIKSNQRKIDKGLRLSQKNLRLSKNEHHRFHETENHFRSDTTIRSIKQTQKLDDKLSNSYTLTTSIKNRLRRIIVTPIHRRSHRISVSLATERELTLRINLRRAYSRTIESKTIHVNVIEWRTQPPNKFPRYIMYARLTYLFTHHARSFKYAL